MLLRFSIPGTVGCSLLLCMGWSLSAQETDPPSDQPAPLPEISDQPQTVDPNQLVPAAVQTSVGIELPRSSLAEVVRWLRDDVGLAVVLKQLSLSDAGILSSEPVSDRLDDEPVHVLLDRLRMIGVGWYYENDILYLTSLDELRERSTTQAYTIGDLLDDGFQGATLGAAIESTIAPDTWQLEGGAGTLSFLGDVMFVRQSDEVHREVQGLLSALRDHGRRTFIHDSPPLKPRGADWNGGHGGHGRLRGWIFFDPHPALMKRAAKSSTPNSRHLQTRSTQTPSILRT